MYDKFSTAVLDLDGTLIDSMPIWEEIDIRWLSSFGIPPTRELLNRFKSMDFNASAAYAIETLGIDATADDLKVLWTSMVYEAYRDEIGLKPFALDFLQKLHRENKRCVLATSCEPHCCEAVMARTGLTPLFDAVCYTQKLGKNKSEPDIFLQCASVCSALPGDCLVFDDVYPAVTGAHKAGMKIIAVYDPLSSAKDWEKITRDADGFVMSLEELL